jgi:hypothetical protein
MANHLESVAGVDFRRVFLERSSIVLYQFLRISAIEMSNEIALEARKR